MSSSSSFKGTIKWNYLLFRMISVEVMFRAEALLTTFNNNNKVARLWPPARAAVLLLWCSSVKGRCWVFSGFGLKCSGRDCCGSLLGHLWGLWKAWGLLEKGTLSFFKQGAQSDSGLCMSTKIAIYNSGHLWAKSCKRFLFPHFFLLQTLP